MRAQPFTGVHWVTGASTGIGRALALALAARGAVVAASARSAPALEELARSGGGPGRIVAYPADVTDRAAMDATVAAIESELGPIRRAILNAGVADRQRSAQFSAQGYRRVFEVNVLGVANGLEALLARMRARGGGEICLMGSLSAYRGLPEAAPYGASKAALLSMAESLAPALARDGIRLRIINPGFVRTPMTAGNRFPMPFLMDADRAAALILRGLRGRRFEIAFPLRLAWLLRAARCLPAPWWFAWARRMLPHRKK